MSTVLLLKCQIVLCFVAFFKPKDNTIYCFLTKIKTLNFPTLITNILNLFSRLCYLAISCGFCDIRDLFSVFLLFLLVCSMSESLSFEVVIKLIQNGYASAAEAGIMEDLSLSSAQVSALFNFSFCFFNNILGSSNYGLLSYEPS